MKRVLLFRSFGRAYVCLFYIHVEKPVIVPQCKLIVCQMSNTRCQPLTWLLLPMALVVGLAVTGVVANEVLLLYLWTAAVILAHIHYGVSVVGARAHSHKSVYDKTESYTCLRGRIFFYWFRNIEILCRIFLI